MAMAFPGGFGGKRRKRVTPQVFGGRMLAPGAAPAKRSLPRVKDEAALSFGLVSSFGLRHSISWFLVPDVLGFADLERSRTSVHVCGGRSQGLFGSGS